MSESVPEQEPAFQDPPARSLRVSFGELSDSRHLLVQLARRDLTTKHAGSALGFLWSLITPIVTVVVYATAFHFLGVSTVSDPEFAGVPFVLFLFAGLVIWNFFSVTVSTSAGSVVGAGFLIRKIYFPREAIPLSVLGSTLVTLVVETVVLLVAAVVLGHAPGLAAVYAVLPLVIAAILATGMGFFFAAATVYFRDLEHFVAIFMQLLFWATPIIYDIETVRTNSPLVARLLGFNPLAACIKAFRETVVASKSPDWGSLGGAFGISVVILVLGWTYFNRHERRLAELV